MQLKLTAICAIALSVTTTGIAYAQCSNGYCANDDSPVVGGIIISEDPYQSCNVRDQCTTKYSISYGVFGAVEYSGYQNRDTTCPLNTAKIEFPGGYKAYNGKLFRGSRTTFVCAKSDTFNN